MNLDVWPSELIEEYYREGHWDDRTLSSLVAAHAREKPDAPAFYDLDGGVMSWSGYDAQADRIASVVNSLGLERGIGIGVMLPDLPVLHATYVGLERSGHFVAAIASRAAKSDVAEVLRRTRAEALITLPAHRGKPASELIEDLRDEDGWTGVHIELTDDDILLDGKPADDSPAPKAERALGPDELFLVNFTSGTTGKPKCVMHTQNRWKYFHKKCRHFNESDVFLIGLPVTGGFGLWMSHFSPLLLGAPAVLMSTFTPEAMLAAIERWRVSVVAAVPTQMHMLMRCDALETTDLSSLRIVESGGEHVPYQESARFEEITGSYVIQFYGSTEAGCVSGPTLVEDSQERRLNTSGRPIPEMNVRLFDDEGNDVTASGRGRCGARGPALTPGYFEDEEATRQLYRDDGWLLLGDIVEIDDQGYLSVAGRISDFIIRGGLNISTSAVEDAVRGHPDVDDAAAVRMKDEIMGERVCVFAVTVPGKEVRLDELVAFLEERKVSKSLWPERLICRAELPQAEGGKVSKKQLEREIDDILQAELAAS